MSNIPPIEDSYIDSVIKSTGPLKPGLNKTQGLEMRALIKLLRNRLESEIAENYSANQAAISLKADTDQVILKTTQINGKSLSGNVTLDKNDIGLTNVDNTADADKPLSNPVQAALSLKADITSLNDSLFTKVDKVLDKQLSSEDFSTVEKNKLTGIQDGATANESNGYLLAREHHTGTQELNTIAGLSTALDSKVSLSEKGQINGIATLDGSGKVPIAQIGEALLGSVSYQGNYNAATNNPTLPAASANKGKYYVVSAAGTQEGLTFQNGDWIISNGAVWQKVDNSSQVTAVNGMTGAVNITDITGNAASATSWGGKQADFSSEGSNPLTIYGLDNSLGVVKPFSQNTIKSWLGTGNLQSITDAGNTTTNALSAAQITSSGANSAYNFNDRATLAKTWSLSANNGVFSLSNSVAGSIFKISEIGAVTANQLSVIGTAVAAGTSNLDAKAPLTITGGKGGDNLATTGFAQAGNAGEISITGGNGGGAANNTTGVAVGGKGGNVKIVGGNGGLAIGNTAFSGNGGEVFLKGGVGYGGGLPGDIKLSGGVAEYAEGKGGSIYISPGLGNASGVDNQLYNGSIYLGLGSQGGGARGNTVIGGVDDDRSNRLQVTGSAKITALSGTGDRPVYADASGKLGIGPIPTTNNGTPFTAGRIPFTTGSNNLQDSDKLKWDNTNKVLTIEGTLMASSILSLAQPSSANEVVNKGYLDSELTSLGTWANGNYAQLTSNNGFSGRNTFQDGVTFQKDSQFYGLANFHYSPSFAIGKFDLYNANQALTEVVTDNVPDGSTPAVTVTWPTVSGKLATVSQIGGVAPSPTSTGSKGQVIIAGGYRYECTGTNTWVRSALETSW